MNQPLYANSSPNQSEKLKIFPKQGNGQGLNFQVRNTDRFHKPITYVRKLCEYCTMSNRFTGKINLPVDQLHCC